MEVQIFVSVSRNYGEQHKTIYIDIWDTIIGSSEYSQVLGNTDIQNLSREIIIRIIIFTGGSL